MQVSRIWPAAGIMPLPFKGNPQLALRKLFFEMCVIDSEFRRGLGCFNRKARKGGDLRPGGSAIAVVGPCRVL